MGSATRFLFLLTPSPHLRHRCPSILRLSRHQLHCHRHRRLQSPLPPQLGSTATRLLPIKSSSSSSRQLHAQAHSPLPPRVSHPWPEFHALLDSLSERHGGGGFNRLHAEDAYVSGAELPEDFVRAASACLSFARDRPNLLRLVITLWLRDFDFFFLFLVKWNFYDPGCCVGCVGWSQGEMLRW